MSEFKEYDKVNILAYKGEYHFATIRKYSKEVEVDIDDSINIDDLEQILTKMKELQGEQP